MRGYQVFKEDHDGVQKDHWTTDQQIARDLVFELRADPAVRWAWYELMTAPGDKALYTDKKVYLTVADVAVMLRVHRVTVYRLVDKGTIKARGYRILAEDFYSKYPICRPSLCVRGAAGRGTSTATASMTTTPTPA